jgi:hypothetical protein
MATESIVEMLVKGRRELAWFNANLKMLREKYDHCFVAFSNEKIIDSDANLDNLMKKLQNKGIEPANVLIEFISKAQSIL